MAAEIQYLDLRSQGSMLKKKKRLKECNLHFGGGPRLEEDFQGLLTDLVTFSHALLEIDLQRKCLSYSRGLCPRVLDF
jgi:hypothetical protein